MDLRFLGGWLSRGLKGRFSGESGETLEDRVLKRAFSILRFLLEHADLRKIPTESVILPVPGAGGQEIEAEYIAGPLLRQCVLALREIPGLETISFCDRNPEKGEKLVRSLEKMLAASSGSGSEILLSYCSCRHAMGIRAAGWRRSPFPPGPLTWRRFQLRCPE